MYGSFTHPEPDKTENDLFRKGRPRTIKIYNLDDPLHRHQNFKPHIFYYLCFLGNEKVSVKVTTPEDGTVTENNATFLTETDYRKIPVGLRESYKVYREKNLVYEKRGLQLHENNMKNVQKFVSFQKNRSQANFQNRDLS